MGWTDQGRVPFGATGPQPTGPRTAGTQSILSPYAAKGSWEGLLSSALAFCLASSCFGLFCSRLTVKGLEFDVRCSRCPRLPHLSLIRPSIVHDAIDETHRRQWWCMSQVNH